jgi:ATP-binding cassette subfamily B protein
MHGRTTFVIAHRLATIRDAHLVVVLREGEIVERGPFAELVARGGFFARLYATQFGEAESRGAAAGRARVG